MAVSTLEVKHFARVSVPNILNVILLLENITLSGPPLISTVLEKSHDTDDQRH